MSKWDEIREGFSRTTKSAADKTKQLANKASLKVKLNGLESKVSEEYDTLGRLYYSKEVGKVENSDAIREQIKTISDINKQINALHAELREIKRIEAEEKAAREAEKEAKKAAREADRDVESDCDDCKDEDTEEYSENAAEDDDEDNK